MQRVFERVGQAAGLIAADGSFTSTIFEEMSALANQHGALNLGQGFPDTDGPAAMLDAAAQALATGVNQYATIAGIPALRQAVATHQARFYGLDLDPDTQVTVTAGASEALAASIAALVEPGEEVILFEPYYDLYPAVAALAGARVRTVPLVPPTFEPDLDALEAAFSERTALVVVNDPHNPTGAVFSLEAKQKIADLATRYGAVILADEVYEHMVYSGPYQPIQALPGAAERTLAVSAISKTHSATGWRVGWVTGPADLVAAVRLVKGYLTHSAAAPLQAAAAVGVGLGDSFYEGLHRQYAHQRQVLLDGLAGTPWQPVAPDGTFFAVADVRQVMQEHGFESARHLCQALPESAGVALIPLSAFVTDGYRPAVDSWVRFAFCKRPEVLQEATTRLRAFSG
ncbi:aminotransferase class I/II-fold pyridoxal phosphate-dependent enzyme [Rothia nasimurium]|uniref:aminotransferase class I/II-fold pyridoxal phosphate-dependent enzyme n=1 Tax=Rothia nasimurium TaxID=85336 RepID=UPI001EFFF95F|nr:aminotransferase class I/II-fold pyridoxal phosphate-dependent enzyme [Rothia nasimurium]